MPWVARGSGTEVQTRADLVEFLDPVCPVSCLLSVLQGRADGGDRTGQWAWVLTLFFPVSPSQLNLSRPMEEQGPLDVIIHKLTDVILEADQNDSQSLELVHRFQVSEGGEGRSLGPARALLKRQQLSGRVCHRRVSETWLWSGTSLPGPPSGWL